jgi:hemoglobin
MSIPDEVRSSRLELSPGHPVGVTEAMISALVRAFYGKARKDPLLGPLFDAHVEDWPAHFAKLDDFWSSVMLMSGRYHGAPMPAHARLDGLGPDHFARWLDLFAETARETCPPAAAALFIDRSQRIARSLQMGIALARGDFAEALKS